MSHPDEPGEPLEDDAPRGSRLGHVIPYVVLLSFVGAVGVVAFQSSARDDRIYASRDAFVEALDDGDVGRARRALSAERQATMSVKQLAAFVDHPVLRALDTGNYGTKIEWWNDVACMQGSILREDGAWAVELSFIEQDGTWPLHGIAIQPPATMPLFRMLPECGYDARMNVGYEGPPIERSTPPTR